MMNNNHHALVSILVNCYNSEVFLQEALDSIYAQTYQNFQILLVDNCSTDQTPIIAKQYDSRLLYIKTEKLIPLYSARNFGLRHIKGDYLAFLDSDDVWFSDKLEKQINAMKNQTIDMLYTNYGNIFEHKSSFKKLFFELYLSCLKFNLSFRRSSFIDTQLIVKNYDINLQTVIMRTTLIKKIIFNEELNLYGDFDFFLKIFLTRKIAPYYLNIKTSLSRVHEKQLSRKSATNWVKESKICYRHLSKIMDTKIKREFLRSHILFHLSSCYLENRSYSRGLKIKLKLSSISPSYFIHFLKSSLLVSKKLLSKH